jgi:tetratricopeptide (TPR) repeat protein
VTLINRGNALCALKRFDEALLNINQALALEPRDPVALNNLAIALNEFKRFDEAFTCFEKAISIDPDLAIAHWNESLRWLTLGDFERGLVKYEWRWKLPKWNLRWRGSTIPSWLGNESIEGKRILLYNEQGFGDEIQFCRYVPLLAAQGAKVILEVEGSLTALMSGLAGVSQCIAKGDKLPEFDLHCSVNSLPLAFKTRLETIPSTTPYLPIPAQASDWEARLGRKDRPRIGLVWSGNPGSGNDRIRSINLRALLPLLDVNATFISLQKDVRPDDEAILSERKDVVDLGPSLKNFADTAAVISQLDLVISVDTSVAHLAGALGKPVWILLPFIPDWRWLLDREDSPWYPTARLFRQDESRAWPSVIERAREALGEFVGPRGPTEASLASKAAAANQTTVRELTSPPQEQKTEQSATTTVAELLKAGVQHQQSGRLSEAEACYQRALTAQPDHADALHLLGLIFHQTKLKR